MKYHFLGAWLLALFLIVGGLARAADNPDLTGKWVLNERLSTDLAQVMAPGLGLRPGGEIGGRDDGDRRGMGSRGGGRKDQGRGGDMPGSEPSPDAKKHLEQAKQEYSRFEHFHDGVELNVTNGLDISQLIFTDGRQMKIWTQQGEASATSHWENKTLVMEWQNQRENAPRIRRFQLAADGQTLTIYETRRFGGQSKQETITLVYDRQ